MVRGSRGAGEPSGFLVVVADSGESIEKSSEAAGRCRAFVITVHQRGRGRKLAEGAGQSSHAKFKELVGHPPLPKRKRIPAASRGLCGMASVGSSHSRLTSPQDNKQACLL